MKLTFALLATFLFAAWPVDAEETTPAATPLNNEQLGPTVKKRLRHVGKNIEKLGKQAGEKVGARKKSTDSTDEQPKE